MPRYGSSTLGFPSLSGVTRRLIVVNVVIYFVLLIVGQVRGNLAASIYLFFGLEPVAVLHGYVWQILTYSFLHPGLMFVLFNMLSLWFIGSYMESEMGGKWLTEAYFFSVIGAALTSIAISYTGILHLSPATPVFGSTGGLFGIFAALAVLFGDREFMMFPLPFTIKARNLVLIYLLIALAVVIGSSGAGALAQLGGALFGFIYVKAAPRRGLTYAASERYFGVRNQYYRWKRRRAARKFEVYMRKHNRDDVRFDKEGRYIDPDKGKDPNDKRWMN
jgi:membrane associated rhomboid family serine protease